METAIEAHRPAEAKQLRSKPLKKLEPSESAYEAFVADARALDAREVVELRGDLERVFVNVRLGVAAVFAHETILGSALPNENLGALKSLPDLARAVAFAEQRAKEAKRGKPAKVDPTEKRARKLRKQLAKSASALVEAGTIQKRELEQLSGKKDARSTSADCITLAALLRLHANEIAGDPTAVAAQLDEAAAIGLEISRRHNGTPLQDDAEEIRDRLWTLLCLRHDRLWRLGAYLFGRKLADKRVPSLGERVKKKKVRALELASL